MIFTERELTAVSDLLSTLNISHTPTDHQVGIDVTLTDSNGEPLGRIEWRTGAYVLVVG